MNRELNLRNHQFQDKNHLQQEVEHVLDKYLHKFLHSKGITLRIVVGKGLNSKNFFNGKNPLRHYTENYLNALGLKWRNGGYREGQEGVIIVEL